MKKLLLAPFVLMLAAGSLFAGGDKVHGDKGQGSVNQVQVEDPPPFQDPATVDPSAPGDLEFSDPEELLDWLWLLSLTEDLD